MSSIVTNIITQTPKKILTEDTGKMFEMAICLTYGIPYDGKYKYGLETPEKLKSRLTKLPTLFPLCSHTAKRGSRYDYTAVTDQTKHLSAKTTKKDGKVAPQVVGQSQPQKFCETLGIPFTNTFELKKYIQENIVSLLPQLLSYTLDCDSIYYNEKKDTIQYIHLKDPIHFSQYSYHWTCPYTDWNNSSTLKIVTPDGKVTALLEVQFHSASRTNMAVRWCFEEFLVLFKDNLEITPF